MLRKKSHAGPDVPFWWRDRRMDRYGEANR